MNIIVITFRKATNDYLARIDGHDEFWGCGETQDEAIGSLVRSFRDKLGIEIHYR